MPTRKEIETNILYRLGTLGIPGYDPATGIIELGGKLYWVEVHESKYPLYEEVTDGQTGKQEA